MRKSLAHVRQSAKQKRELKKLADRPDSEIDFSDIPEEPGGYMVPVFLDSADYGMSVGRKRP